MDRPDSLTPQSPQGSWPQPQPDDENHLSPPAAASGIHEKLKPLQLPAVDGSPAHMLHLPLDYMGSPRNHRSLKLRGLCFVLVAIALFFSAATLLHNVRHSVSESHFGSLVDLQTSRMTHLTMLSWRELRSVADRFDLRRWQDPGFRRDFRLIMEAFIEKQPNIHAAIYAVVEHAENFVSPVMRLATIDDPSFDVSLLEDLISADRHCADLGSALDQTNCKAIWHAKSAAMNSGRSAATPFLKMPVRRRSPETVELVITFLPLGPVTDSLELDETILDEFPRKVVGLFFTVIPVKLYLKSMRSALNWQQVDNFDIEVFDITQDPTDPVLPEVPVLASSNLNSSSFLGRVVGPSKIVQVRTMEVNHRHYFLLFSIEQFRTWGDNNIRFLTSIALCLSLAFCCMVLYYLSYKIASLRAQRAQKEASLLRLCISGISDPMVLFDEDHRILFANDRFVRVTGFQPQAVEGRSVEEIFSKADWNELMSSIDKQDDGDNSSEDEGQVKPVPVASAGVIGRLPAENNLGSLAEIPIDPTEMFGVFPGNNDVCQPRSDGPKDLRSATSGGGGGEESANNQQALAMWSWLTRDATALSASGGTLASVYRAGSEDSQSSSPDGGQHADLVATLTPWLEERMYTVRLQNGSEIYVDVAFNYVSFQGRKINVMVFRDLSAKIRIFQELRVAKQHAVEADRAKGRFLSFICHELRNPLHGITGMADELMGSPMAQEHREVVQHIAQNCDSMRSLMNDVLDLNKIEAGGLKLEPAPYDLFGLLHNVESSHRYQAETRGLKFRCRVVNAFPPCVALIGDPIRLRQIFDNLIDNCMKFTKTGHVSLTAFVKSARFSNTGPPPSEADWVPLSPVTQSPKEQRSPSSTAEKSETVEEEEQKPRSPQEAHGVCSRLHGMGQNIRALNRDSLLSGTRLAAAGGNRSPWEIHCQDDSNPQPNGSKDYVPRHRVLPPLSSLEDIRDPDPEIEAAGLWPQTTAPPYDPNDPLQPIVQRVTVRFVVVDSGIGVPAKRLPKLFQRYRQAHLYRKFGGTGLGLSIVQELVRQMGGAIHAISEVDRGTAFWFDLSFDVAAPEDTPPSAVFARTKDGVVSYGWPPSVPGSPRLSSLGKPSAASLHHLGRLPSPVQEESPQHEFQPDSASAPLSTLHSRAASVTLPGPPSAELLADDHVLLEPLGGGTAFKVNHLQLPHPQPGGDVVSLPTLKRSNTFSGDLDQLGSSDIAPPRSPSALSSHTDSCGGPSESPFSFRQQPLDRLGDSPTAHRVKFGGMLPSLSQEQQDGLGSTIPLCHRLRMIARFEETPVDSHWQNQIQTPSPQQCLTAPRSPADGCTPPAGCHCVHGGVRSPAALSPADAAQAGPHTPSPQQHQQPPPPPPTSLTAAMGSGALQARTCGPSRELVALLERPWALVADDVHINREIAWRILQKAGYAVDVARNGLEVVNMCMQMHKALEESNLPPEFRQRLRYAVILMDIQMPVMDGVEATRLIRARGVDTPVLAMTGTAVESVLRQCMQVGMDGFVTKPFRKKDLLSAISRVLK